MFSGSLAARLSTRLALVVALGAGLVASGCDSCGEPPGTNPQDPYLILSTPAGTQLEADGSSTLPLTVVAFNDQGLIDTSPITIITDLGEFISDVGTLQNSNQNLVVTPSDAAIQFSFRCPGPPATGTANIQASNASSSFTATISCIEPRGQIAIRVEDASCSQLSADGDSNCPVTAFVELQSVSGGRIPQRGVPLTAEIISARILDDPSQTQVEGAQRRLLSTGGGGGDAGPANTEERVTGSTADDGSWMFYMHSVTLAQELEVQIQITGTAADGTALDIIDTVVINPFDNRASVDVVPAATSISAGQTIDVDINATDATGNPAAGEIVTVRIPAGSGATIDGQNAETEVTLDSAGAATLSFVAPATVTAPFDVPISAEYQPADTLPNITTVATVRIFPANALLVNLAISPEEIKSDDNEIATITATVTRFNGGQVQAVQGADVTFTVAQSDIERIILGSRAGDPATVAEAVSETNVQTDVDGEATQQVASRNSRARGRAAIDVHVVDGNDEGEATIEVDLIRDPILQSIVFVSATPAQIAVRGGAYPSASEVAFRILDDLNQPMTNVPVTFDTNATADPAASVVQQGLTDESGGVSTVLSAGTQAGPISVVAVARFNGVTLVAESEPVPVTGGLPSFTNSYIACDPEDVIQIPPFEADCTAVLADRFTNRVPDNLPVQFRVEAGNVQAVERTGQGAATATVLTGTPGPGTPALLSTSGLAGGAVDSWSYGNVVPLSSGEMAVGVDFTAADRDGCFDSTTNTPCNVFSLCKDAEANTAANLVVCPLPYDAYDGVGCWDKLEAAAVTGDAADLSAGFKASLGLNDAAIQALLDTQLTPQVYYGGTGTDADNIRKIVDAHIENMNRCGAITSCITGQRAGVPFIFGDECPSGAGCYDFAGSTVCPQDSLLTITAIARGEEGFSDLNGNGTLDFIDSATNPNGRHDPGEVLNEVPGLTVDDFNDIVVDMPEPFLDKDDNCFADDHSGSLRLTTYDAIRLSDTYSDEDGSGGYGYLDAQNPTGEPTLTNGQWDRDKQIFVSTHMVALRGLPSLDVGIYCPSSAVGTDWTSPQGLTCPCEDRGDGNGIARGCVPTVGSGATLNEGDSVNLLLMWTDLNGVCYSPNEGYSMDTFFSDGDVTVSGNIALEPITPGYCGLTGSQFPRREWCTSEPVLGSKYASVRADIICNAFTDNTSVIVHLHDSPTAAGDPIAVESINLATSCP